MTVFWASGKLKKILTPCFQDLILILMKLKLWKDLRMKVAKLSG